MNTESKSIQVLKSILGSRTVSYNAIFAKAIGSATAAIFLSQAYFWQENANFKDLKEVDGKMFFDKTIAEWYDVTGLSEEQQKTAREKLKALGILLESKIGLPAKLHYHIDFDSLVAVIYRYKETGKQVTVDNRSKSRQNARTGDGKFRPPVAVNYRDTICREYIESKESKEESAPNGAEDKKNEQVIDLTHVEATYELSTPGGAAPAKKRTKEYDFSEVIDQLSEIEKGFLYAIYPEWSVWIENKKVQHKFTYKLTTSHAAAIRELINISGRNTETAKKVIQQSISNGWKGLFLLKAQSAVNPSAQKPFELIDNPHLRGVYPPGHPKHVPNQ